ncbi:MAG TPA: DUF6493 family protein [Capillimicrobium sp.]
MTDWPDIERLIAAQDVDGLVAALVALDERERRSLGAAAVRLTRADGGLNAVAGIAVWGTGSLAQVERLWAGAVWRYPEAVEQLLVERRPEWLDAAVDRLCASTPRGTWPLARSLQRRGLYAAQGDGFVLAMISHGAHVLDEDPALLDREVWRLFEVEGGGETSLAATDKYLRPEDRWARRLAGRAAAGRLDRDRLLDATLAALGRGFSAFRAGWFTRFHDALEPTDHERRERVHAYLDLLASPTPQIGAFALKAVVALDAAEPLPPDAVVRALAPAVLHRNKGTATRAVALLDATARRSPPHAPAAALLAGEALLHESPDVQRTALDAIERHGDLGDPALRQALADAATVIAPSLRDRLAVLAGTTAEPVGDAPPDAEATARAWPATIPEAAVLEGLSLIVPITTIEELAPAVARALEHPDEPDEVERVLDAISRMPDAADAAPAVFRPMRKQAQRVLRDASPFAGQGVGADLAGVVLAWVDGAAPEPLDPVPPVMGFCSARAHAIATRAAAREPRALLSAPTHPHGWIDARALIARDPRGADEPDRVLALLRVAPDGRAAALASGTDIDPALAYALGASGDAPESPSPIWVAAERARAPGCDPSDLGRGPAGLGVQRRRRVVVDGATSSPLYPTISMRSVFDVDWERRWSGSGAETVADVRWCATVHPADPDPLTIEGLAEITGNLDWSEARWHQRAYLEPLLRRPAALSDLEVTFLALALDAKEPGVQGLAGEIAAATLLDGRLSSERLGRELGRAWSDPFTTPRRYARSLAAVAAVSRASRRHARAAMLEGLAVGAPHTDAAPILELLNELCSDGDVRVDAPAARAALASVTGAKAGRLAASLLARP